MLGQRALALSTLRTSLDSVRIFGFLIWVTQPIPKDVTVIFARRVVLSLRPNYGTVLRRTEGCCDIKGPWLTPSTLEVRALVARVDARLDGDGAPQLASSEGSPPAHGRSWSFVSRTTCTFFSSAAICRS